MPLRIFWLIGKPASHYWPRRKSSSLHAPALSNMRSSSWLPQTTTQNTKIFRGRASPSVLLAANTLSSATRFGRALEGINGCSNKLPTTLAAHRKGCSLVTSNQIRQVFQLLHTRRRQSTQKIWAAVAENLQAGDALRAQDGVSYCFCSFSLAPSRQSVADP